MGQKSKIPDSILEVFYERPGKEFTVRRISELSKVPRSTVQKYLSQLRKSGLVTEDNAAETGILFRTKKANHYIEKIIESGLIDEIVKELSPSCIILFGSIRKGDSVKESDIDLFVETPVKKELKLSGFEKKLKHKIQILTEPDIQKLPDRLFNNVVNGIKLYGFFKVR